ncbi:MAG TPA: hypothetical protein VNQ77_11095 [Frankiaceae bacterium]|nr:hypothetical protein [Frankiaceae bacterium]
MTEPEFVSPLASFRDRLLGRKARTKTKPLDDGSTLDVRCPRCAARLRARCGRTNNCPRCGEKVAVPGADVARSLMPAAGEDVVVRRSLQRDETHVVKGPLVVLGYEPPWYLVRVRGTETGWVSDAGVRLVEPKPPTGKAR